MKLLLSILTGFLLLQSVHISAQEITNEEKSAAKIEAKEAKRLAKEEKKAAKEEAKAEESIEKAERKQQKREENEAKFEKFLAEWEPVDYKDIDPATMPNTIDLFKGSNELFTTMKNVYSYIDYIQIETNDTIDAEGINVTEYQKLDAEGNELGKNAKTKNIAQASLDLTNASLMASNVLLSAPLAVTEAISDPLMALTLGKKVKKTFNAVKMSIQVIPLLKAKCEDNKAARRQDNNN